MGQTTISDIARLAGVSTATVDRALNGRQGVRPANRQRVLKAARDLGYLPSEGAVILPSRPASLEFLIPFSHNAFMRELTDSIEEFTGSLPLVANCKVVPLKGITADDLIPALDRMSLDTDGVGLITTDHPRTRLAIQQMCDSGLRVVTIASDVLSTPRSAYVGVDNRISGRTAAQMMGMMSRGLEGPVALFLGSRNFHGHQERELGFRTLVSEQFPNLTILPANEVGEDSGRSRDAMTKLLRKTPGLVGIYCVGAGRTGIVEALRTRPSGRRPLVIMHDLTDNSRSWLVDDLIDVIIDQNPRLVGEQAVIRLLGAIAASSPLLPVKNIEPRIILRENIPSGRLLA